MIPRRALATAEQPDQVVASHVLAGRAAHAKHSSRGQHGLNSGHPGTHDAVLEAVRAARVRCDVAADLRLLGRSRVDWKAEAVLARQPLDYLCRHAGLYLNPPEKRIERPDPVQPLQRDDDAPAARVAPPANPVPPPRGTIGTSSP
jgi:hypothetical protein